MTWHSKEPGHQQPWCWPSYPGILWSLRHGLLIAESCHDVKFVSTAGMVVVNMTSLSTLLVVNMTSDKVTTLCFKWFTNPYWWVSARMAKLKLLTHWSYVFLALTIDIIFLIWYSYTYHPLRQHPSVFPNQGIISGYVWRSGWLVYEEPTGPRPGVNNRCGQMYGFPASCPCSLPAGLIYLCTYWPIIATTLGESQDEGQGRQEITVKSLI